ncbi:hypothetical protein [Paraburkholderia fungorum]|uniref:hypothetical protein n=1 Tax=Paraburkholderia fungorum TaxID=134537 RepID=UPI0011C38653|nr:hypothetical protein [Paraburkholderia fungorum]
MPLSAVDAGGDAAGKLIGSTKGPTPAQLSFVSETAAGVKAVQVIPSINDGRSADFFIDGIKCELKIATEVVKLDSDGLLKSTSSTAIDARGQSGNIIIDACNQSGMTPEIAQRGIDRAFSANTKSGSKIKSISVITSQGAVFVPGLPQ